MQVQVTYQELSNFKSWCARYAHLQSVSAESIVNRPSPVIPEKMDPHLGQAAEPIREKCMSIRKRALSNPVPKAKSVPEFGERAFQGLSAHYFRYL
jgi:hypothetical protein